MQGLQGCYTWNLSLYLTHPEAWDVLARSLCACLLFILGLAKYHIVLCLFLVLPYREPMTATIYCPLSIDLLSVALPSQDRPRDKMICLWSAQ